MQVGGKAATGVLGLLATIILTRGLSLEAYGQFLLITAWLVFLDTLADFGTRLIGVREMARGQESTNLGIYESRTVWSQMVWLRMITTGASFVLAVVGVWWWQGFEGIRVEAMVAIVMMWLTMVAGNMEMVWQARLRMGMKVMSEVLFSLLALVFLFLWRGSINLLLVFEIYLAARILSLVVGMGWLERITGLNRMEKWQKEDLFRLWKEVWPMGVYLLVFAAYDRVVDSLMIERFLGIREVAWYGLGYKIYAVLIMPAYFLMGSVFPLLAKRGIGGSERKIRLLLMGGAVAVVLTVTAAAPVIVGVMGGDGYGATVNVLRGLMVALFFAYNNHWLGFKLIAGRRQREVLWTGLAALMVNVLGNLWAIPRFGIMGAVVVTGLTEIVSTVMMTLRFRN